MNEYENIEFERDGQKKTTQARFKDALILEGWSVAKRRGRPPKNEVNNDNSQADN